MFLQSFHNVDTSCKIVNARDVHDESTIGSLLCLLPDLLVNALWHATTSTKSLAWSLVFEACLALNTIFDLSNFMSFQVTVV